MILRVEALRNTGLHGNPIIFLRGGVGETTGRVRGGRFGTPCPPFCGCGGRLRQRIGNGARGHAVITVAALFPCGRILGVMGRLPFPNFGGFVS